jgi:hypothetical protein
MNVFEPESRQPPSTRAACVAIEPNASLPAPGSVRAQAPIFSIVITGSANRSRWVRVPRAMIAPPQSPSDAPNDMANPGQTRESSIIKMVMSGPSPTVGRRACAGSAAVLRAFANAARTMSATPKVAQRSRMSA